jgi:hypothetical protein
METDEWRHTVARLRLDLLAERYAPRQAQWY